MKNTLLLILIACVIIFNAFLGYKVIYKKELLYVNTIELYNNFTYKKELEKKLISVVKKRETILEKIKGQLLNLSAKAKEDITEQDKKEYRRLSFEYKKKQKEFDEDNAILQQDYDKKIRDRINIYVGEYGKSTNKKIIFGANGTGSIIYADESIDITKDVLKFINDKYEDN